MRIDALLRDAAQFVPMHEARALLAHVVNADLTWLVAHAADDIDASEFQTLLARRIAHEPLQFIIGTTGFWDFTLEVSADTLIPRPDSETLVEAALQACSQNTGRVLDLGTGTGCLLLAFLRMRPGWLGVGVDLAPAAAALAARNANGAGVADRAAFLAGNWAESLTGNFDLVLSNPPYIQRADLESLESEVRDWEPNRALDGGADGLDAYRSIIADLPRLLAPQGVAVLELGIGQAAEVVLLAGGAGLAVIEARRDLGGIERALVLKPAPR
jgi:release factor glutamine methyltransferase